MNTILRSTRLLTSYMLLALAVGGCASSSLQEIHDTYQSEFRSQLSSASSKLSISNFNKVKFPETMRSITNFRQKYPSLDTANKHTTVLEALIYLQSGQYGQAKLAASTAERMPGSLTTYGGGLSRDELLLRAMNTEPGLIGGWKMLAGKQKSTPENLELAAQQLQDISSSTASSVVNGDDGRLYIAAVSSMLWRKLALTKILGNANGKAIKKEYGAKMTTVLDPHLTTQEKGASATDVKALSSWALRYRYVRLYQIGRSWENL